MRRDRPGDAEMLFSSEEARRYWEVHARQRGSHPDPGDDPDGLGNVCHPGAPRWLNQHFADGQRRVFVRLLDAVPASAHPGRALDVGCGAGRWARLLAERGFEVTGVDLQEELIAHNRAAMPEIRFICASILDFDPAEQFDFACAVTVLQHLPYLDQAAALRNLRAHLRDQAHVLLMENVLERGPHVFSRSISGWRELLHASGFEVELIRPYDYGAAMRLAKRLRTAIAGTPDPGSVTPESYLTPGAHGRTARSLRAVARGLDRVAVAVDSRLEPTLVARRAPYNSVHCAFLARAV
jgi:SAM-dependent methyltransferase